MPEPRFFARPEDFRAWLDAHHSTARELLVGFHKRATGKPSITWPEAVDEALCVGWIDGVRRSLGPDSYTIRFTPRRPRSIWSAVNIQRAKQLRKQGRLRAAGLKAFEARAPDRSAVYSYEQRRGAALAPEDEQRFRASAAAWTFFQAQAPWYRRAALHWVTSAKKPETRARRLGTLIADSAHGRTIAPLTRKPKA
jgi:uncharacterized protein YdeI (YjbR/CyaY-like superfamily)